MEDKRAFLSKLFDGVCGYSTRDDPYTRFSDVVLLVGKDDHKAEFKAHKVILAGQSDYFLKLFTNGMQETYSSVIEFTDKSPEAFKVMLEFFYRSSTTHLNPDNVFEVLQLASEFSITDLQILCSSYIAKSITEENVLLYWQHAIDLNTKHLAHNCREFVCENAVSIINSKRFLKISKEMLVELLKEDALKIDEFDLFQRVVAWGRRMLAAQRNTASRSSSSNSSNEQVESDAHNESDENIGDDNNNNSSRSGTRGRETLPRIFDYTEGEQQPLPLAKNKLFDDDENNKDPTSTAALAEILSDVLEWIRFPVMPERKLIQIVEPTKLVPERLLLEAYRYHLASNIRGCTLEDPPNRRAVPRRGNVGAVRVRPFKSLFDDDDELFMPPNYISSIPPADSLFGDSDV